MNIEIRIGLIEVDATTARSAPQDLHAAIAASLSEQIAAATDASPVLLAQNERLAGRIMDEIIRRVGR